MKKQQLINNEWYFYDSPKKIEQVKALSPKTAILRSSRLAILQKLFFDDKLVTNL